METNEGLEKALMQGAESQIKHFIEGLQSLEEGDLKSLEEQVMSTINTIGCLMMEITLSAKMQEQPEACRREGACGQTMRLAGIRGKQLQTLMGPVTFWRAYYHCAGSKAGEEESGHAAHGEAAADEVWGVQQHRCSVGVQQAISRLGASMTLEEAAETLSHLFPVPMSARQALNLIQPVGEAIKQQAEEQQQELFKQAVQARSQQGSEGSRKRPVIRRLYVEIDGVLARLRRGSVPMEEKERKRPGDVYREVKVGAVFLAEPGRKRSALTPGVFVDAAGRHRVCGSPWQCWGLCPTPLRAGPAAGSGSGTRGGDCGRWSGMDLEPGGRALSHRRANCGSLACQATCLAGRQRGLWSQHGQMSSVGTAAEPVLGRGQHRSSG